MYNSPQKDRGNTDHHRRKDEQLLLEGHLLVVVAGEADPADQLIEPPQTIPDTRPPPWPE
jgi:hypothetical protein